MNPEFILPFKGRNVSDAYNQNFLYRCDTVYIMDNHRAALWCWLQHIKEDEKYNLLHIDQHYDCLSSRIDEWIAALPQDIKYLSAEEYTHLSYLPPDHALMKKVPIIRFDNYLSIFLRLYAENTDKCVFATHGKGERPNWDSINEIPNFKLVSYVSHYLEEDRWLVNVDLDYFFYENYNCEYSRLCSDEYIDELFNEIAMKYNSGHIAILTLSMSPETCGGWKPSEILISRICRILRIKFSLPQ